MGGRPASVKNYRDEFDPLFPNTRQGWHKRPLREHCRNVLDDLGQLELEPFATLVRSYAGYDENFWSQVKADADGDTLDNSSFARRLMTGLAAENYFESLPPTLPEFMGYGIENTTRLGCGYDFRLRAVGTADFLAVEVKGLQDVSGSILLTPKEYETAGLLSDRFYLFVVKNFRESPFHEVYHNPMSGMLSFARKERMMIHVSWHANL